MLEAVAFRHADAADWDAFVKRARNGHFFFKRRYMEYHADRFTDHSLVVRDGRRTVALLPANRVDDVIYSHRGLTFGGLIIDDLGGLRVHNALDAIYRFLRNEGVRKLVYKAMPAIYHRQPAQEDLYALHRAGARLVRRDLSSALALRAPYQYSKGKVENLARARKAGLTLLQESDAVAFMGLLEDVLESRHEARPTHTSEEMQRLLREFPENIRVYSARLGRHICAGALLFLNPAVAHTQYLANSNEGRAVGALDFLIDGLIKTELTPWSWLSFGISTEDEGRLLNDGLLQYKEAFGARGILHDTYELGL